MMNVRQDQVVDLPVCVTTAAAAAMLNRKPATLRAWAHMQVGPITPIRIFGRLAWKLDDIRALLHGPPDASRGARTRCKRVGPSRTIKPKSKRKPKHRAHHNQKSTHSKNPLRSLRNPHPAHLALEG